MKHDSDVGNSRARQVRDLTSFMLHKHYCENDPDALIALFDESLSWFGAAEQEYAVGTEAVAGIFRQFEGQVPTCNITDEQYDVIPAGPETYVCSGRLWITTDPSTNVYLRAHQRITAVFRLEGNQFRCCHIHISNPYGEMSVSDIGFPTGMARQSSEYLQEQVELQRRQLQAQTAQLWHASFEDSLTELYNRNKFNKDLLTFRDAAGPMGILFFDMNGLKTANDRLGHSVGDQMLRRMSAHIRRFFPEKAYRVGGDEILVVDLESDEAAFRAQANAARAALEQDGINCAMGLCWRASGCDLNAQCGEAERLMYQEKQRFYRMRKNDRRGRREL